MRANEHSRKIVYCMQGARGVPNDCFLHVQGGHGLGIGERQGMGGRNRGRHLGTGFSERTQMEAARAVKRMLGPADGGVEHSVPVDMLEELGR